MSFLNHMRPNRMGDKEDFIDLYRKAVINAEMHLEDKREALHLNINAAEYRKAVINAEKYLEDKGEVLYVNIADYRYRHIFASIWVIFWFIITSEYALLYPVSTSRIYKVKSVKISDIYYYKGKCSKLFEISTIKINGLPKFRVADKWASYDSDYELRAYIEIEAMLKKCNAPIS